MGDAIYWVLLKRSRNMFKFVLISQDSPINLLGSGRALPRAEHLNAAVVFSNIHPHFFDDFLLGDHLVCLL